MLNNMCWFCIEYLLKRKLTFLRLDRSTKKNFRVGFIVNSRKRIGEELKVKLRRISEI